MSAPRTAILETRTSVKLSPPPSATTRPRSSDAESPPGPLGWEISLSGDLYEKQKDLTDALVEVPFRSKGVLYFDSCGGSVYVGLALATLMRLRGLEATGIVGGECSSAAFLPFAACTKRFVTPHSTFFFHPIQWTGKEDLRADEAVEWTRYMQILETDIDRLTARFLGIGAETEAKIAGWIKSSKFLTGSEIADAGLATLLDVFAGDLASQLSQQS